MAIGCYPSYELHSFPSGLKSLSSTSAVLSPHSFVSLAFRFLLVFSHWGPDGALKFSNTSLCTCHNLLTPEALHILTKADASVLTSVDVKPLVDPQVLISKLSAMPVLRSCVLPTACTILCVRFTYLVRTCFFSVLRHRRNTRYGWLVKPFPTGTFTP